MTILFLFSLMLGKARDNSSICSENKLLISIPYTPKLSRAIMWEPHEYHSIGSKPVYRKFPQRMKMVNVDWWNHKRNLPF